MAEVVARVDDEVGLERDEVAHPLLLAALPGRHVQVGEMQHRDRICPSRQDRHRGGAQGERRPLDQRAPDRRRGTRCGDGTEGAPESGAHEVGQAGVGAAPVGEFSVSTIAALLLVGVCGFGFELFTLQVLAGLLSCL